MNVFLLVEERNQTDFKSTDGYYASPESIVVGVFDSREKAERKKILWEQQAKEEQKKFNCDTCSYIIEERPLL